MISYFNRLRAKKGFTMIELIVVIAIIGVLTSIVVVAMSGDTRITKGKAMAKDIYYVAQDAFNDLKITDPKAISSGERVGFYVEIDSGGAITSKGIFSAGSSSTTTEISFGTLDTEEIEDTDSADEKATKKAANALKTKIPAALENYITQSENMEGTLFVVCDDNFRVEAAYWKSGGPTGIVGSGATGKFSDDNVLDNGEVCCSFPLSYSVKDKYFMGK